MLVTELKNSELGVFPCPRDMDIQALSRTEGPCVSVFLGPHVSGSGSRTSADMLRAMLPQIEEKAKSLGMPAGLTEGLRSLCDSAPMKAGHREGYCLYASADGVHCFSIRTAPQPAWHVEDRFLLIPLLEELDIPREFLLLALAGKHVRLLRCADGEAEPIPIPDGVPESVAEFSHNARGTERGEIYAIGVSSGSYDPREKERGGQFRREFMKQIDKGLLPIYRGLGLPLVLAGVDAETSAYAAISGYHGLVAETVQLSPDGGVSANELARGGARVLAHWCSPRRRQALNEFEKAGPGRRSSNSKEILAAARSGKVHHLFLARGGSMENGTNMAAVEVLRHRGLIWLVEPDQMPDAGAQAAVYRYTRAEAGAA